MTFNQIVLKMAKVQYKKYIVYYVCNSFAVMFFFMFLSVYFNDQVVQAKKLEGIQEVLTVPVVALVVFTVFFINYAHTIFIKRRKSEFGLFMTLGMSGRDISKLLLLENGVIALASIISGILSGTIFSRLFFLLLMKSVGLEDIPFHLNAKMFMYSIGIFLAVFSIVVGKSLFLTLNRNLLQSLKSDRVRETIKLRSPLFGAVGLAMMVGSALMLYFTFSEITGGLLLLWTIAILLGLYISLNQFMSFFIEIAKKNKPFYFKRLLSLSSLDYKFKQLTSILMLVTVMIMVTIFYSSLVLTFYQSSEKQAIDNNPYDLAFVQTETKNNLPLDEIYSVIDKKEHPVKEHLMIPTFTYYQYNPNTDWQYSYVFMSVDDFNQLTSSPKSLQNGEYMYYENSEPEYASENNAYAHGLAFPIGNDDLSLKMKESITEKNINLLSNAYEFIIVSHSEFELLKRNLEGFESTIQLFNVANWKETTDAVEELEERLHRYNQSNPPIEDIRTELTSEEDLVRVESKIADYNYNKNTNGIMFFVITFLSVSFFFGTFILLYLNLFSDIDREKEKYRKLYKIGITVKEVKRIISKELITLFFIPIILGTTLAYTYIVVLATDVGGIMKNPELLVHFGLVAGIYLLIQVGYFLYARRKMVNQLTENNF
ncbi:FtsX-like permease family protein [Ferdinandcohnia quinoae]|uniref:ABC transporter permease n=1 Tax=Fredinandcohnia quinoae TaxID=2918902 RepID=A0AAW5DZF8_9BACI|nr:ABC transporter permease [Fredinandcohnia sp. SECRCQ15]MCH1625733.1 ABC transporter permease [Fredinandcohnia sp. SECRCQ15]